MGNFRRNLRSVIQSPVTSGEHANRTPAAVREINQSTVHEATGLITCPFTVDGSEISGMVDTGASSSFIRRHLVEDWCNNGMQLEFERLLAPVTVVMGDSRKSSCEYRVKLMLDHDGQLYETSAYISETLPFDLVIGMKFLKRYNAIINLDESTIKLDPDAPYNFSTPSSEAIVYLSEEISVPAKCEILVNVKSNKRFANKAFLRNFNRLVELTGVYVGKGIVKGTSEEQMVSLANMSESMQVLPAGTIVGRLEFFDEEEWAIVMDVLPVETMHMHDDLLIANADEFKTPEGLDLSNVILDEVQLKQLQQLLYRYGHVFNPKTKGPPVAKFVNHSIDTGRERPIHSAPYHVGHKQKVIVDSQIKEMLDNNVIRPSRSPWSSPVVLVNKKDGNIRFCIDYRKLNQITKKDVYPLPRIDDCLSVLGNAKFFSTFDLVSGYWQIPVNLEDQEKTAFISHAELYEFIKMPFGLTNAPATFQRYMDIALAGLKWTCCLVYLDDIIVFSSTFEEHLVDVEAVFKRLEEHNLGLKASKCHMCRDRLLYLGHQISPEGISPNPDKVKAINEMDHPRNRKELRRFLGMCSYYRKFIKNFADIASPLNMLNKDHVEFHWQSDQQEAFEILKCRLISPVLLKHPNFAEPFIIQTDASDEGIGAVLCQRYDGQEHVTQYISRTLQPAEKKWATRDKEALAILWACEQFRPYVVGTSFIVESDHESLQWLRKATTPARVVRWAVRLDEFDFSLVYKKGIANPVADALSRTPKPSQSPVRTSDEQLEEYLYVNQTDTNIREEQQNDLVIRSICTVLTQDPTNALHMTYFMDNGTLMRNVQMPNRPDGFKVLVLPQNLRETVLDQYHEKLGHIGRHKMFDLLRQRFYWAHMYEDIRLWTAACLPCAKRKPYQPKNHGELQPIVATYPFETVAIDIVGPLSRTKRGNKYILVMIDLFTNWVEIVPLKTLEASETADGLFRQVIIRHGCPTNLLSDRGTQFTSHLVKELCAKFNITKMFASAYHPQTNGKCERVNRFMINCLSVNPYKERPKQLGRGVRHILVGV